MWICVHGYIYLRNFVVIVFCTQPKKNKWGVHFVVVFFCKGHVTSEQPIHCIPLLLHRPPPPPTPTHIHMNTCTVYFHCFCVVGCFYSISLLSVLFSIFFFHSSLKRKVKSRFVGKSSFTSDKWLATGLEGEKVVRNFGILCWGGGGGGKEKSLHPANLIWPFYHLAGRVPRLWNQLEHWAESNKSYDWIPQWVGVWGLFGCCAGWQRLYTVHSLVLMCQCQLPPCIQSERVYYILCPLTELLSVLYII